MKIIRNRIDRLMRSQPFGTGERDDRDVYNDARGLAAIEHCTVVVSDLRSNSSRIFHGRFSERLGLSEQSFEPSIWESEIIGKMDGSEQKEKYLSELRFFHFLRRIPPRQRPDYALATHLRFRAGAGYAGAGSTETGSAETDAVIDVLHRMFYRYDERAEVIRYAVCTYGPLAFAMPAKSMAVNSVSGEVVELSSAGDNAILSKREKQILTLVGTGLTSREIADRLFISKHTVSRHRQGILSKLKAKNSAEALRTARMLQLI